jgi:hypothetical protein
MNNIRSSIILTSPFTILTSTVGRPAPSSPHPPSRVFSTEVQNGGIELRQIAHEVCAGAAIEAVEVGLTVGVRERYERERSQIRQASIKQFRQTNFLISDLESE